MNNHQVPHGDSNDVDFELVSMKSSGEIERNRLNLTLNLASLIRAPDVDLDSLTPKEDNLSGKLIFNQVSYYENIIYY